MAYMVSGNKFNPYTFEEMIKPVMIYNLMYDKSQLLIEDTLDKIAYLYNVIDETKDSNQYKLLNNYANSLNEASLKFYNSGLDSDVALRLNNIRRDYFSKMKPLEYALAALEKELARRMLLGADYVYQNDDIRIGDFMNGNKVTDLGINVADLENRIGKAAATLAASLYSDPSITNSTAMNGYYKLEVLNGLPFELYGLLSKNDNELKNNPLYKNLNAENKLKFDEFRNFVNELAEVLHLIDDDDYYNNSRNSKKRVLNAFDSGIRMGLQKPVIDYHRKNETDDTPKFPVNIDGHTVPLSPSELLRWKEFKAKEENDKKESNSSNIRRHLTLGKPVKLNIAYMNYNEKQLKDKKDYDKFTNLSILSDNTEVIDGKHYTYNELTKHITNSLFDQDARTKISNMIDEITANVSDGFTYVIKDNELYIVPNKYKVEEESIDMNEYFDDKKNDKDDKLTTSQVKNNSTQQYFDNIFDNLTIPTYINRQNNSKSLITKKI